MTPIDQVQLAFDANSLRALNVILGLVMFGVALDLRVADFTAVIRNPKAPGVGLLAQFLVLPALTFCLVWVLDPTPSIGLGMMLVAACPGGNLSNFITHLAKGNTSTSVSMTAVSTFASLFMTPLNVSFWGSLHPGTSQLLKVVHLDPVQMLSTVAVLLGIPVVAGMAVAAYLPGLAELLRRPFKILSLGFFALFVVVAFWSNFDHFLAFVGRVFGPVALMNACALALGYSMAVATGLAVPDRRAVSIEVGIQNSGLGLILIFNFFDGLGGMAVVAAWWGIWHILAGMTLAGIWSRRPGGALP